MKKLLLISMLIGAMPLAMMAQDDDLYFVPKKKKAQVEQVKDYAPVVAPQPKAKSSYEVIDGDTTKLDVIDFAEVKGVYPSDTLETEDYALTKKMMRFDDYDVSSNAAFWAGYNAGRSTWLTWHSPWYYSRYGLYEPWYNSYWYNYSPWYYSWYDPWYYGWYDPYYSSWGWPYYGYHSWYSYYWHGGYYDPYYYGGGGGGKHHYYGHTGNSGTRDVHDGTSRRPAYRNTVANNSQRMGSLRDRATSMGGSNVYRSGNTQRSGSGNFSGRRGGNSTVYSGGSGSSSSSSGNRSYSNSSSGSSRSSSSGSFSSGSRSGSFGSSSSGSSRSGGFSSGGGGSRSSSGGHGGGGRR